MNRHHFTVTVSTVGTAKHAELALLAAFAKRSPDDCRFDLSQSNEAKLAFSDGVRAGMDATCNELSRVIAEIKGNAKA